jgi:antitoxin (DNA-binding transcriptional repressor) of toxin-antitoxin stability system
MKTVEVADKIASERALRDGENEEVVVLRDGKPVALIVPFDEDDLLWYDAEHRDEFIQSIDRARQQVRSGDTISHEQLASELGVAK